MRRTPRPSRRGGFTLIELLVVIAILALLVGLTMAGIGRVKSGQMAATTETTVKKLQVAVNQQLSAAFDDANKRTNPHINLIGSAIGDLDEERDKALLSYAYSKRNFPMNFAEANLAILGTPPIPKHTSFAQIPVATGLSSDQQAAVLLYIIVHDQSGRGTTLDADGALAGAETVLTDPANNRQYKAYKDAYGTHIAFLRWYGSHTTDPHYQELQSPPFINPKDGSKDPFDRLGKLMQNPWPAPNQRANVLLALNNLATIKLGDAATLPPGNFDGRNRVITVVSAGPDKTFGTDDDVYGFRLARFGDKAN